MISSILTSGISLPGGINFWALLVYDAQKDMMRIDGVIQNTLIIYD